MSLYDRKPLVKPLISGKANVGTHLLAHDETAVVCKSAGQSRGSGGSAKVPYVRDVWCKQLTIQWAAIVGRGSVQCGVAKLWPDTLWVWHWQWWCAKRHLGRKTYRSMAVKMVGTPLLSKLTSSQLSSACMDVYKG